MMTEEEARKKWCPMAKSRDQFIGSGAYDHCIASECMAWRWLDVHLTADVGITFSAGPTAQGCCGLAGRP